MAKAHPDQAPFLSDVLSGILPTPEETFLLRTCLLPGEDSRKAWALWQEHVGDPKHMLKQPVWRKKGLLPSLYVALTRNGSDVDKTFLSQLKMAYVYEELRSKTYRHVLNRTIETLRVSGIPCIVLKGASLSGSVYEDWALRHCHDIDLLVRHADLQPAARALSHRDVVIDREGVHDIELEHGSGLPVKLHDRLFQLAYYGLPLAEIWERAQKGTISDRAVCVLSPVDQLVHILGHASYSRTRDTLRWVCDAWNLIARNGELDWDFLVEVTRRSRLTVPLSVMLRYLNRELNLPLPQSFLDPLDVALRNARREDYEAALAGASRGMEGGFKGALKQAKGWRTRFFIMRWKIFPSLAFYDRY